MNNYIYIKGRRLYFYDTFDNFKSALRVAKYYQKKLKNNYFILIKDRWLDGSKVYKLYMNKVYAL